MQKKQYTSLSRVLKQHIIDVLRSQERKVSQYLSSDSANPERHNAIFTVEDLEALTQTISALEETTGRRPRPYRVRGKNGHVTPTSDLVNRIRKATGLSQTNFAKQLGCHQSSVTKYELERRTPNQKSIKENLRRLAAQVGVEIDVDLDAPHQVSIRTPADKPKKPKKAKTQGNTDCEL